MKKIAFAVLMSLTLVGCANEDIYSGSVYSSDQAKEARSISYGTIVSTRPVKIQADNQGVIGTIGGGCAEAEVIQKSRELFLENAKPACLYHVDLNDSIAEEEGMVCGGQLDVLLERV